AGLGPAAQERAVEALWRAALAAPFDLARPPLLRVSLLVLEPRRHLLLLSLPALLADAAGLDNLVREIGKAYGSAATRTTGGAAASGSAPGARQAAAGATGAAGGEDAEDEPFQYVDLAAWQHD